MENLSECGVGGFKILTHRRQTLWGLSRCKRGGVKIQNHSEAHSGGKTNGIFFLFRGYRPLYPRESKHRACLKTTQTLPEVALAFRSRPRCVSQLWVFPGRSCRVFGTVAPATWGAERGCRRGQGRDASLNSECGGHWFHRVFTSPPRGTDSSGGSKGVFSTRCGSEPASPRICVPTRDRLKPCVHDAITSMRFYILIMLLRGLSVDRGQVQVTPLQGKMTLD